MTTASLPLTLTGDDVWAMRHTSDVTFHTLWTGEEQVSWIDVRMSDRRDDFVWTRREQLVFRPDDTFGHPERDRFRRIRVESENLADYGPGHYSEPYSAYASRCDSAVWFTIAQALKVGDRIHFGWIRNNNSEALEKVGFVRDGLRIGAQQPTPDDGARPHSRTWNVADSVGPDNSARMVIRPATPVTLDRIGF
jgi:hypothetical protein